MIGNHYILTKSNPPLRVLSDRNVIAAHNSFKTNHSFLQDEISDDKLLIIPNRSQDFERRLDKVKSDMNSVKSDMNSVKSDMNFMKSSLDQILNALQLSKVGVEK